MRWAWRVVFPSALLAIAATIGARYPGPPSLRDHGATATAQVVSRTSDGVRVGYEHQVVGPVTATLTGKAPAGDTFAVRYDLDDPYRLRWVDESDHVLTDAWRPMYFLVAALIPAVGLVVMLRGARRTRALAAGYSASPTFSMLALVHQPRVGSIPRLSLYARDARPGDSAICTIRLADDRVRARTVLGYDEVEVRGWPRPAGHVVVRRDGQMLWPRGRALLVTGPRFVAVPQHPWSKDVAWFTKNSQAGVAATRFARNRTVTATVLTAVFLAAAGFTGAYTRHQRAAEDRWIRTGTATVATVVDSEHEDYHVTVAVIIEGRGTVRMPAPVKYAEDIELGEQYPAVVSADATHIRLRAYPYDAWEPVLWWLAAGAIALWVAVDGGPARRLGRTPPPPPLRSQLPAPPAPPRWRPGVWRIGPL